MGQPGLHAKTPANKKTGAVESRVLRPLAQVSTSILEGPHKQAHIRLRCSAHPAPSSRLDFSPGRAEPS